MALRHRRTAWAVSPRSKCAAATVTASWTASSQASSAGLLHVGHHALAALDGAAQVAGLAIDAAQRDAGLDPGQPVGRAVVDERLELDDGVVLAVGGFQRAGVEQAGALAQAGHAGGRHGVQGLLQVALGVLGLPGLQGELGVVEGEADLVDHVALGLTQQGVHRDAEALGEGLESRGGGAPVAALDAGEVGHRHQPVGDLSLGEPPCLPCGPEPATQRFTVGAAQHLGMTRVHWDIVRHDCRRVCRFQSRGVKFPCDGVTPRGPDRVRSGPRGAVGGCQLPELIIPAPTVTPVASSIRMKEPVVRFFE